MINIWSEGIAVLRRACLIYPIQVEFSPGVYHMKVYMKEMNSN